MTMPGQKRTVRYNFAHVALPILALGSPAKFYKNVSRASGSRYLRGLWAGLEGRMGVTEDSQGLAVTRMELSSRLDALLIRLPAPRQAREAFFLAVIYHMKRRLFKTEPVAVRYFTLELGLDVFDGRREFFVGEWSGSAIQPARKNHGRLPSENPEAFVARAKELAERLELPVAPRT